MLRKSNALEWLIPVLDSLHPGSRRTLDNRFLAGILIIITGKVIFILLDLLLFKNLEQFLTSS